jgi:3-phosphoshikimate 1-carboxyvinyltransferase
MNYWSAPFRGKTPVFGEVSIPGSKSVTNRALILAALSDSPSILRAPLRSRDTHLMSQGLRSLGVGIEDFNENVNQDLNDDLTGDLNEDHASAWKITPAPLFGPTSIDVGNAGTVMRFMLPVAALANGLVNFDGDPRSHERPLGPLIRALEDLGVLIDHHARYRLPLTINGSGAIRGGAVEVDASGSSQFLSALMLAAPKMREGLLVRHIGEDLPSLPHIEMTIQMLREFGGEVVKMGSGSWQIKASQLRGRDMVIEPDLSNAAPFMAIPMICGGEITIRDWPVETTQPGDRLREIFTAMGAKIDRTDVGLRVQGDGHIEGIEVDLHDEGELAPSIAAVAALARTPSYLTGIGHLRSHETDRLSALNIELSALGCEVIEEETALRINPRPLRGGKFRTYEDHRLATAAAMIGLVTEGVEVENVATTRKTIPDFPGLWSSILNEAN